MKGRLEHQAVQLVDSAIKGPKAEVGKLAAAEEQEGTFGRLIADSATAELKGLLQRNFMSWTCKIELRLWRHSCLTPLNLSGLVSASE